MGREVKRSEVAQSCPILCDPVDCSLPGYSVHGILQARILEWVAISFSSGEEGTLQISLVCVGSAHSVWATLGLPALMACVFSWSTLLRLQVVLLSKVGPGFHALPKSKPFRFRFSGTPQRHKLSWACILCPSQVLAGQVTRCLVRAHPPSSVHLITSPIPAAQFPGCAVGVPSQVCCVSLLGSWSLAATLLADVKHPGSQEDLVSNWEPAHSLVGDAVSGAEFAPFWLWLSPASLPASSRGWASPLPASSLWLSHSLDCYLMLAPLDYPQGIQAWSLP